MAVDIEKITDSPHLLDILIQMEDVLDSLDVYVFKNWFKGEIAEGPRIRRYWLDFTLKYAHHNMPDPKAALRLMKHDIRVDFWEAKISDSGDYEECETPEGGEECESEDVFWMVRVSIPRRLITQMSDAETRFYEDEIDIDDVDTAKDTGIDDESAFMDDFGEDDDGVGMDATEEAPEEEAPQQ